MATNVERKLRMLNQQAARIEDALRDRCISKSSVMQFIAEYEQMLSVLTEEDFDAEVLQLLQDNLRYYSEKCKALPKSINDLDDNSLLAFFENLPDYNTLGIACQVSQRWAHIGRKRKLACTSLTVVISTKPSNVSVTDLPYHRTFDGKIIDPLATDDQPSFSTVTTSKCDYHLANCLYLKPGSAARHVKTIATQFPNIKHLTVDVTTMPDDLLATMPLLVAYAQQLKSLAITALYCKHCASEALLRMPTKIEKHTQVLAFINSSLPLLEKLRLNIRGRFLLPTATEFNLSILEQLKEFYLYSSDTNCEPIAKAVMKHARVNLNNRRLRGESGSQLQLGLQSHLHCYKLCNFGCNKHEFTSTPVLPAMRYLTIGATECLLTTGVQQLSNLVSLTLHFTPDFAFDRSRSELLRALAKLPKLVALQLYLLDVYMCKRLLELDEQQPAELRLVTLPTVRYLEVYFDSLLLNDLNHHFLQRFRLHQCLPALRIAFVHTDHLSDPCHSCLQAGITKQLRQQCYRFMVRHLKYCPQLQRIYLNETTYAQTKWIQPSDGAVL